jgi:hypothetical protein
VPLPQARFVDTLDGIPMGFAHHASSNPRSPGSGIEASAREPCGRSLVYPALVV